MTLDVISCATCGNSFQQIKPWQKFCKTACRERYRPDQPKLLTVERLREILDYDPVTGIFTSKINRGTRAIAGQNAGRVTSAGYQALSVDGINYSGHWLAWYFMTGQWPAKEVDHRNGIKSDNRWENLRAATDAINAQNIRKARSFSKSGFLGVTKNRNKYQARIVVDHKKIYLGIFNTPEEAHQTYLEAKRRLHEGCTI